MPSKLEEFLRQTAESESLAQAVPWVQFRKHALGDDLGACSALPGKDTCCLSSSSKLKSLRVITMSHRRVQAGWSRGQMRLRYWGLQIRALRAWAAGLILNVMSCILSHTAQNRLSIVWDVKLQVRHKNSAESPVIMKQDQVIAFAPCSVLWDWLAVRMRRCAVLGSLAWSKSAHWQGRRVWNAGSTPVM